MKLFKQTTLVLGTIAIMATGCESTRQMSNKDKGVGIGAVGGAVLGGVIGSATKTSTAAGAIIGAAVGGVAGGVIGAKMDRQAEAIKNEVPGAKVERVGEGISVTFDESNPDGSKAGVYFATNQFNITDNSRLAMDKLVKIFKENPNTDILVEGHTDNVGRADYNMGLSERRAMAVTNYLRSAGIDASRITTKWYGLTQPVVDNDTPENRALNRRVSFAITANEKMKEEARQEAGSYQ